MPTLIDYFWRGLDLKLYVSPRRKSIAFKASSKGIVVYMPEGLPQVSLNKVLDNHYAWLKNKHERCQQPLRSLQDGSIWPVWGQNKHLYWQTSHTTSGFIVDTPTCTTNEEKTLTLFVHSKQSNHTNRLEALKQFYYQQTLIYAQQRIQYWHQSMYMDANQNLTKWVKSLTVKHYRSRWGSCSQRGDIQLNYLLAMAPKVILDYVLVHELCHLKYMQHNKQFWNLVAQYEPNFNVHRKWLRTHGEQLNFEVDIG